MHSIPQPCSIAQHASPGRGEKSHFGRKLARLFAAVIKVFRQLRIKKYDRFTDCHSILGSTKADHLPPCFQIYTRGVPPRVCPGISNPSPTQGEKKAEFPTDRRNLANL